LHEVEDDFFQAIEVARDEPTGRSPRLQSAARLRAGPDSRQVLP
jgi:hypothetical protein